MADAAALGTGARGRRGARRRVVGTLLLLASSLAISSAARAEEIVAIVHDTNSAREMTVPTLRLIYGLYRRSWEGGVRVHLILPEAESPAMVFLFSRVFRERFEEEIDRYYMRAVFQQRIARRPIQLPATAAIERVRDDPGAVALVEKLEIRDVSGLRILAIVED